MRQIINPMNIMNTFWIYCQPRSKLFETCNKIWLIWFISDLFILSSKKWVTFQESYSKCMVFRLINIFGEHKVLPRLEKTFYYKLLLVEFNVKFKMVVQNCLNIQFIFLKLILKYLHFVDLYLTFISKSTKFSGKHFILYLHISIF